MELKRDGTIVELELERNLNRIGQGVYNDSCWADL